MNHKEIIDLEESGKILIGIDRPMARRFYTDKSVSEIKSKTGETLYFEKSIVWFAFLVAPISLIVSVILSFATLHWWGLITFVLFPFIYFSYSSASVIGNSKITGISMILIISIIIHFGGFFDVGQFTSIITIFLFSLWCIRFLYCTSTFFFRVFVIRNEKAFEYLKDSLNIRYV